MARIEISGVGIEYELLGPEGAHCVSITPGGRMSMAAGGVRELGEALALLGKRVLLWDRPNCGLSDWHFEGDNESAMQGRFLTQLIRALDLGPTVIAGGSGGSRVSMLAAARDPDICSHLVLWWISGDPIGLMQLATCYCGEAATLASQGGMDAVMNATSWAENFASNPAAAEAIRAMDPDRFIAVMQKWAAAYAPSDISPVPGMKPADFARLTMPVQVYRSGRSDLSHTRATSEWVARLIPHCDFRDPPWGEDEWNERQVAVMAGREKGLFTSWPRLAPKLLELGRQ